MEMLGWIVAGILFVVLIALLSLRRYFMTYWLWSLTISFDDLMEAYDAIAEERRHWQIYEANYEGGPHIAMRRSDLMEVGPEAVDPETSTITHYPFANKKFARDYVFLKALAVGLATLGINTRIPEAHEL